MTWDNCCEECLNDCTCKCQDEDCVEDCDKYFDYCNPTYEDIREGEFLSDEI